MSDDAVKVTVNEKPNNNSKISENEDKSMPASDPAVEERNKFLNRVSEVQGAGKGLTDAEVTERIAKYGVNEIEEHRESNLRKFIRYFIGPIPLLIEVAAILSIVLGSYVDFGIMVGLLVLNAVIGFWQEYSSGNAVQALKLQIALKSRVFRNQQWITVDARELVPGDLIHIKLGDSVPADACITEINHETPLSVDQAALTGESQAVKRRKFGKILSSSLVKEGEAEAIVTETGMNTYIGKAAGLVAKATPSGHLEKILASIGHFLVILAMICVAIIILYGLFNGFSAGELIRFCLVLLIASIPIALPVVMSATMAVGGRELSKHKAILTRLTAIEELAAIDVLCSDKTGTLTKNELSIEELVAFNPYTKEQLTLYATLACKLGTTEGLDPIDQCIVQYNTTGNNKRKSEKQVIHALLQNFKQVSMKPFDPVKKRAEALVEDLTTHKQFIVSKGASQVIFNLLSTVEREKLKKQFDNVIQQFASRGMRSLAVARKPYELHNNNVEEKTENNNWEFVGLISIFDPPREDSAETIHRLFELGVEVKVISGDQTIIVRDMSHRLGLSGNIISAPELRQLAQQGQPEDLLAKLVENAVGFGEVYPDDKHLIVTVLQKKKHMVAMTGDGVNDAPALKQANVGIAVSGATDAARAAADIVLLESGLSVIVEAIIESRRIFARMNGYALYRCVATVNQLLFLTLSVIIFNFILPALMLILIAVFNDLTVISIAWDRAKYKQEPVNWNLKTLVVKTLLLGGFLVFSSFLYLWLVLDYYDYDRDSVASLVFIQLATGNQLTLFSCRVEDGAFISYAPSFGVFSAIIITQFVAGCLSAWGLGMTSVGWGRVGLTWVYCLLQLLVFDVFKQMVTSMIKQYHAMREIEHKNKVQKHRTTQELSTLFPHITMDDQELSEIIAHNPNITADEPVKQDKDSIKNGEVEETSPGATNNITHTAITGEYQEKK